MVYSLAITVILVCITLCLARGWMNATMAEDRMSSAFLTLLFAAAAGLAGLVTLIWFIIRALS